MWPTPASATSRTGRRLRRRARHSRGRSRSEPRRRPRRERAGCGTPRGSARSVTRRRSACGTLPGGPPRSVRTTSRDSRSRAASRRSTTPAWATAPATRIARLGTRRTRRQSAPRGGPEGQVAAGRVSDRRPRARGRAARRALPAGRCRRRRHRRSGGQPPRLRQPSRRYSRFQTAQPRPARSADERVLETAVVPRPPEPTVDQHGDRPRRSPVGGQGQLAELVAVRPI